MPVFVRKKALFWEDAFLPQVLSNYCSHGVDLSIQTLQKIVVTLVIGLLCGDMSELEIVGTVLLEAKETSGFTCCPSAYHL